MSAHSQRMSRVRSINTTPELMVRRLAHRLGFRFRLHVDNLPGSPDLVFPRLRKAIFVHGCFWHRHHGCKRASTPKTNVTYWNGKFERNLVRDERALIELNACGWATLVVWECQVNKKDFVVKLGNFLQQ